MTTVLTAGLLLAGPAAGTGSAAPATAPRTSTYTSLSPVRVLDTRSGAPVGPGSTVTVDLASRLPADVTAVVLTVTGVEPTAPTYVTVFNSGVARPAVSSLNLVAGDTRANQVTVTPGANGTVSLYNNAGNTHLVADLAGYYSYSAGARFTALPAERVLDSRWDANPFGPGTTRVLDLAGLIPASATAVTFNLTATETTASTYVTAWPTGTSQPTASNLNVPAGDTRASLVTVAVGADRKVNLYNNAGTAHLIGDLTGFYTPEFGVPFVPLPPTRLLDTRDGTGGTTGPVGARGVVPVDLNTRVPWPTTGVLLNVTAVDATASTYVTAAAEGPNRWTTSMINLSPGQTVPNAAMVMLGESLGIQLYNNAGNVHLVADIAGMFVTPADAGCTVDCAYAWGYNAARRLGTNQARPKPTAARVALSGVRAIAGSSWNGYAVRTDGTVWAWGNNSFGQLGGGWRYIGGSYVPAPVHGLTGVTAVAAGYYTGYALRGDGTVWAWGYNGGGALGDGTRTDSSVPVQVAGLTGVVAIASGMDVGYALRADGTVWAWGDNTQGELGNGSTVDLVTSPVQVSGLTGVTAIAAGNDGGYALLPDGTIRAWGANGMGELGYGQPCSPCESGVPVQVSGLTAVTAIAGGGHNAYAVRADGTAWAWGQNDMGNLGNGAECDATGVTCLSSVPVQVSNLSGVTEIESLGEGGFALLADGTVRAWGNNYWGALGNDSVTGHSTVPVAVTDLTGVTTIAGTWGGGYALVP